MSCYNIVILLLQEDYVELDGVRIDKPFVEKPASGEDHNIHIYYPHSMVSAAMLTFAVYCSVYWSVYCLAYCSVLLLCCLCTACAPLAQ